MINTLLSYLAPHYCCECGKIGTILCDNCKYDIIVENFSQCLACGSFADRNGLCILCKVPYSRGWCVGERSGSLQRVIGNYKFQNMQDAHKVLGDLLLERLDYLPPETVIVPIPTISTHIRQRGYDHTLLIAKYIAARRGHPVSKVLRRATSTKQRQATKAQRIAQAKKAFVVQGLVDPDAVYLLVDDVVTTGATLHYAAQTLKDNGARVVWAAVIARQPLDG